MKLHLDRWWENEFIYYLFNRFHHNYNAKKD